MKRVKSFTVRYVQLRYVSRPRRACGRVALPRPRGREVGNPHLGAASEGSLAVLHGVSASPMSFGSKWLQVFARVVFRRDTRNGVGEGVGVSVGVGRGRGRQVWGE